MLSVCVFKLIIFRVLSCCVSRLPLFLVSFQFSHSFDQYIVLLDRVIRAIGPFILWLQQIKVAFDNETNTRKRADIACLLFASI